MKNYINKEYFKSKVFKKLFYSYVLIILSLFLVYTLVLYFETVSITKERQRQYYNLKMEELTNAMDVQLADGRNVVSNINSSEVIRQFSSNSAYENAINPSQVLNEIKNYTVTSNNINIYDTVLFLEGFDKAFSSSQTFDLKEQFSMNGNSNNGVSVSSINFLMDYDNTQTLFNKDWLIYFGNYNSGFTKGKICILYDKNSAQSIAREVIGEDLDSVVFKINGLSFMGDRNLEQNISFEKDSYVSDNLRYNLLVDVYNLRMGHSAFMVVAISIAVVVCGIFVVLALLLANKYYQPLEDIEKIIDIEKVEDIDSVNKDRVNIENNHSSYKNEFDNIIKGLENLVGERNGYRQKMLSIKPYAQQGMLHGMLNGNLEIEKLNVLFKDDYMVLQKPYFVLSIINIAYVGSDIIDKGQCSRIRTIIEEVCKTYSNEDTYIAVYDKSTFDLFIIINSNINESLDEIFLSLYNRIINRIDSVDYAITIGVDEIREDITQLSAACNNAMKALEGMVIGGRGGVYYYEKEISKDKQKYYFPKDAINRLTKALKERNLQDIADFLQEIYKINTTKYDASARTIGMLIDEVHLSTIKALKTIDGFNTIEFDIERLNTVATLEEVFEYYYAIYQTICSELDKVQVQTEDINELDKDILQCIDEQFCDSEMSLNFLTNKFGVSNKYISLICKKNLGKTYLQYLQEKRINYAIELIKTTNYSIEKIAQLCGYTNLLTFRRNFKAVTDMNPSEYKR